MPTGIFVLPGGDVLVCTQNNQIRRFNPTLTVSVIEMIRCGVDARACLFTASPLLSAASLPLCSADIELPVDYCVLHMQTVTTLVTGRGDLSFCSMAPSSDPNVVFFTDQNAVSVGL